VAACLSIVLQGSVVISEDRFIELFPDAGGYRFLIDTMAVADPASSASLWTRQLEDRGFESIPAWERLNEFNSVQNTYLGIFSTLVGLACCSERRGLGS